MSASTEQTIFEAARGQHGIVARPQLIHAGLSPKVIKACVRSRRLRPVFRGVYQVSSALSPEARDLAAVLACGRGACLSHESAAGRGWKIIPAQGPEAPVDVMISADRNAGNRTGIRVHRVRRHPSRDVTVLDGIPITTPARTLFDLAGVLGARALEQALATAERMELLRAADLTSLLDHHPRHPGAPVLRVLVSTESELAFTRSEAEERLLAVIDRAELPRPALNAQVAGYQVDFLFRPQKVVVEVDGFAFHASKSMFERDRSRDGDLQSHGFRILRVTWNQLSKKPEVVLARLARTLAHAELAKP